MIFDGIWSRQTHPKDFPTSNALLVCLLLITVFTRRLLFQTAPRRGNYSRFLNTVFKIFVSVEHLTHFSDLIGGSHSAKYTMWSMGGYPSDGLKDLAEWGDTRKYEEEIKEQVR
jgi:hypothetical protein